MWRIKCHIKKIFYTHQISKTYFMSSPSQMFTNECKNEYQIWTHNVSWTAKHFFRAVTALAWTIRDLSPEITPKKNILLNLCEGHKTFCTCSVPSERPPKHINFYHLQVPVASISAKGVVLHAKRELSTNFMHNLQLNATRDCFSRCKFRNCFQIFWLLQMLPERSKKQTTCAQTQRHVENIDSVVAE